MATGRRGDSRDDQKEKEKVYLTAEGRAKLEAELEYLLTVKRPQVAQYIHEAKEGGDITESSAYEEAKHIQGMVEGRILELQRILANAVVLDPPGHDGEETRRVRLGSTVEVETSNGRRRTFTLVGTYEADAASGRISDQSPVGSRLLNHSVGDEVEVETPGGIVKYIIRDIRDTP
jgi:transcription elongation factor GreA